MNGSYERLRPRGARRGSPPFCTDNKAHGRLTHHEIRVVAVEAETIGLPFAQAVISVTRTCEKTTRGKPESSSGVRYFVTSLDPLKHRPEQIAEYIRGHWSIENKNHWKRDAQWREDSPRFRNPKSAQVLAVLLGATLALCNEPCPQLFLRHCRHPVSALRLINSPLPALK
jgi:predicted transposase YbfD/YdcC